MFCVFIFQNYFLFCFISLVWPSNAAFSLSAYVHLVSWFMMDHVLGNLQLPHGFQPLVVVNKLH